MTTPFHSIGIAGILVLAACSAPTKETAREAPVRLPGTTYTLTDTTIQAMLDADGVAQPFLQATLSTKLTGNVASVLVTEGDAVEAGQPLVRIDARELTARHAQLAASLADAEAIQSNAATQAGRIRALYADEAATRSQLDGVETGLARANAGVHAAQAAAKELDAMNAYSVVRAPFAGIVTHRFVDPGAFATPGAPLVTVQDASQLRVSASVTPDVARGIRRGQQLAATVEGTAMTARVEGVIPAATGNLYTINALVANAHGTNLSGSTATLSLPLGMRKALVVPTRAVSRSGDLTGVTLRTADGDEKRWVQLGHTAGSSIEVISGLRSGDVVIVPPVAAPAPDGRR
ncbi:MAG: efflux RND transporter periplasmic adaptor subunit [Gemmatimonadaceae bacterium]